MEQVLEFIWSLLGVAITFITGKFFMFLTGKMNATENEKEAFSLLKVGIDETFTHMVKPQKKENGGKLTEEQKAEARKIAYDKALGLAKGPVKDIILSWGMRKGAALINEYLSKKPKRDKK